VGAEDDIAAKAREETSSLKIFGATLACVVWTDYRRILSSIALHLPTGPKPKAVSAVERKALP
jgi:hypothetical protein